MSGTTPSSTSFWGHEPSILFRDIDQFFPRRGMTPDAQLNAITRLILYVTVAIALVQGTTTPLMVGVFAMAVIYVYQGRTNIHKDEVDVATPSRRRVTKPSRFVEPHIKYISPTRHNPFTNRLPYPLQENDSVPIDPDSITETALQNPSEKADDLDKDIEVQFHEGLYQDLSDVFGKTSSQRQFYTMPNTSVVNRQGEFADWLYGDIAGRKG